MDLVRDRNGEGAAVDIKAGYDNLDGVSARAKGFLLMIEKFQNKVRTVWSRLVHFNLMYNSQLPDMDFPINAMAEGRILVPWEHRQYPNLTVGELCPR